MNNLIFKTAYILAQACGGNPVFTTSTIFVFYIFFNVFEALIETLIFGDRFEHWLDPLFVGCFIAYSAYSVWACAVYNVRKNQQQDKP